MTPEFSKALDSFLDQLVFARGLSENTREAYGNDLRAFGDFLSRRGIANLESVRRIDIVRFLGMEQSEGFAETTRVRRLNAIRTFFTWLYEEEGLPENPSDALLRPRLWQRLPESLTEAQVARLLAAADGEGHLPIRNRAMLELLYACGLRASELCGLQLEDLHLDEAFLRCTGKGSKQRVVPIGASAIAAVRRYLADSRPLLAKRSAADPTVFLSIRGRGISRESLWRVVAEAAGKAGLAGEVHPHTLRHCFATHLLDHGANIRAIQEMLGHADISTTQIYTHVDTARLLDTHRRFHPRP